MSVKPETWALFQAESSWTRELDSKGTTIPRYLKIMQECFSTSRPKLFWYILITCSTHTCLRNANGIPPATTGCYRAELHEDILLFHLRWSNPSQGRLKSRWDMSNNACIIKPGGPRHDSVSCGLCNDMPRYKGRQHGIGSWFASWGRSGEDVMMQGSLTSDAICFSLISSPSSWQ